MCCSRSYSWPFFLLPLILILNVGILLPSAVWLDRAGAGGLPTYEARTIALIEEDKSWVEMANELWLIDPTSDREIERWRDGRRGSAGRWGWGKGWHSTAHKLLFSGGPRQLDETTDKVWLRDPNGSVNTLLRVEDTEQWQDRQGIPPTLV